MKHRRMIAALMLGIALLLTALDTTPAAAASPGEFVSKINGLRASKGLGALSVDGRLSGQAQQWAEKMASVNAISHNPNLKGTPGNWTKVGENVGTGGSVAAIFDALVASPGHYRNMVDGSFNSVGVGIAMGSDGRIYTCHVFAAFPGSTTAAAAEAPAAKPAAQATKSAPTTAPKATVKKSTSTTRAPATTATTAPVEPEPAPAVEPAPAPPAPPAPSQQIVSGLAEVGSLATQG